MDSGLGSFLESSPALGKGPQNPMVPRNGGSQKHSDCLQLCPPPGTGCCGSHYHHPAKGIFLCRKRHIPHPAQHKRSDELTASRSKGFQHCPGTSNKLSPQPAAPPAPHRGAPSSPQPCRLLCSAAARAAPRSAGADLCLSVAVPRDGEVPRIGFPTPHASPSPRCTAASRGLICRNLPQMSQ